MQRSAIHKVKNPEHEISFEMIRLDITEDSPERLMELLIRNAAGNLRDSKVLASPVLHHSVYAKFLRSYRR